MNKKANPKSSGCLIDFYFILKYIITCLIFDQMVNNLCSEYISFLCKYLHYKCWMLNVMFYNFHIPAKNIIQSFFTKLILFYICISSLYFYIMTSNCELTFMRNLNIIMLFYFSVLVWFLINYLCLSNWKEENNFKEGIYH